MNEALHGCSYSKIWVSPDNWRTVNSKSALKKDWYVQCYFFDPAFKDKYPRGKPIRKKLNRLNTIEKRRAFAELCLAKWPVMFEVEGYNPITKKTTPPQRPAPMPVHRTPGEVYATTPFIEALEFALEKAKVADVTRKDLQEILLAVGTGAEVLNYHYLPIGQIKRSHIRYIIDCLEKSNGEFSGHKFNKYRGYLSILFKVLVQYDAVESNIIKDIEKRVQVKTVRETLTKEQRYQINCHLRNNYRSFWIFSQIFFHSGGRETELMNLKVGDVDLKAQTYKTFIKKGRQYTWVYKTIKNIAIPFWEEVLNGASDDLYVFSVGLVPGPKRIRTDQINKRWMRLVKKPLGITADFYSLKHSNLDEVSEMLSISDAAAMASHTNTAMIEKVYATGQAERKHERLKKISNEF